MSFDDLVSAWWNWATAISWQLAIFVALTWIVAALLRKARPRIRHTLWLLVLLKIVLPTSFSAPWSLSSWLGGPSNQVAAIGRDVATAGQDVGTESSKVHSRIGIESRFSVQHAFVIWIVGVGLSVVVIGVQYFRLCRRVAAFPIAEEGSARVALERAALSLKLSEPPELRLATEDSSPFLVGILSPVIVIPESLAKEGQPKELDTVLLHELVHWKHKDTWVGWGQVAVQCLMWFHPAVWLANTFLNHERETVCDEEVLRAGNVRAEDYSETILRVLKLARGRSFVASGMVGVFERGARIQNRLESIMQFDGHRKRSGMLSRIAVLTFAILFLPMAPWPSNVTVVAAETPTPETPQAAATSPKPATQDAGATEEAKPAPPKTPYPQIVKLTPAPGSTKIDPTVDEIRVTFDRDMGDGMSWTGGGSEFPTVDKSRTAGWIDKRTCVLPVTLKRGSYYRLGINAKSFLNFKSADGKPVPPMAIFFTTKGATRDQENRVMIPQIVKLTPANGDTEVKAATRAIRVTFNVPMGEGMSWTGGGELFPEIPQGKRPTWSNGGRTCTLPVTLQPNHEYKLGLNSLSHNNFQSKWGVPLAPIVYSIHTASQ